MRRTSSALEQPTPPRTEHLPPNHAEVLASQAAAPAVFFIKRITEKKEYTIYLANRTYPPQAGVGGDIWFSSTDNRAEEAFNLLNRDKRAARMNKFSGSLWYHSATHWVPVTRRLDDSGDGVTEHVHPQIKRFLLDCLHFAWRAKSAIMATKRRRDVQEPGSSKRKKSTSSVAGERGSHSSARYLHIVPGDYFYSEFDFVNEVQLIQSLANLAMQWQAISTFRRENREAGSKIFRVLLSRSEHLDGGWDSPGRILAADIHKAKWGKIPRLSDIFRSASMRPKACSVIFCGTSQYRTTRFTPEMVMETWVMGSTNFAGLCSIVDIPDPEAGEKYMPTLPAHIVPSPGECEHSKNPATGATWVFSAVPGAGLILPHVDSWASEVYINHIQGKQLWLMWPGTAENYRHLYGSVFAGSGRRLDTVKAIDLLQGLEILFVSDEHHQLAWTLPAGTIYAVVTLSPAATHGGFHYMSYNQWKQCQNALQALQVTLGEQGWHGDESSHQYLKETLQLMETWAKMALDRRKWTRNAADFKFEEWIIGAVQRIEKRLTWLGVEFSPVSQSRSWLNLLKVVWAR